MALFMGIMSCWADLRILIKTSRHRLSQFQNIGIGLAATQFSYMPAKFAGQELIQPLQPA